MGEKHGTQIDDLISDINNTKLSSEENTMVDSIINDLNSDSVRKKDKLSQQEMPQISDEEREMLMKQQEHEQRMMMEHQMRQQQHMHEQRVLAEKKHQEQQDLIKAKENELLNSPIEKLKGLLVYSKDAIVVFILTIMFNIDPINEVLKFKTIPFFYDIDNDNIQLTGIIFKALIIALTFLGLQYFSK